jgi:translation initiation factor eIF-2B subunit delta
MVSDKTSENEKWIEHLIIPIRNDLLSGAAEIALQAIVVFKSILSSDRTVDIQELRKNLKLAGLKLIEAQPAMASLVNLANIVLIAANQTDSVEETKQDCLESLNKFEKVLCDSVAKIADTVFNLLPPGEMVFAYSFSSTVVSCLLNARAKGRYFRVACSESRPSMEGRKLASHLASGGIEVISTVDSAMGMILPSCSVAFMGCDCISSPGLVNKSGSFLLALACHEMNIPLYALCDTTKFIDEEHFFEFENHQRPGVEVWEDAPPGVTILNRQFELIPFDYITGLITENGLFTTSELPKYIANLPKQQGLQTIGR